jgi:hypothetical protein
MALYWDWFQYAWGEWVVNYDFGHQITLTQNVQRSSRDYGSRVRDYYNRWQERAMEMILAVDQRVEGSPYFLRGLLVFLIALLIYLRRRTVIEYAFARWALRARARGDLTASLAAFEYREMLKLLEAGGWSKLPSQTPREFAAAIPAAEFAGPVMQMTEMYQAARFGEHPSRAAEMAALLAAIRDAVQGRRAKAAPREARSSA